MLQAEAVNVVVRGSVEDRQRHHAQERVAHAARHVHAPISFARVILTAAGVPPRGRPVKARAVLDVSGRTVQANASAANMHEAIDRLHERLRRQLQQKAGRRDRT